MLATGLSGCNSKKEYVKVSSVISDGDTESTEEWIYNKEGQETEYYKYDENDKIVERYEVYYDGENKEERYCYEDWDGDGSENFYSHFERYYEQGKIIKEIVFGDTDGTTDPESFPMTITYEYDEEKHQVTMTEVNNFGEKLWMGTADFYNGEFFMKTEKFVGDDDDYEYDNKFEFDENDNVIKYTTIDREENEVIEDVRYQYDEDGNRIKAVKHSSYYDEGEEVNYTTTTKYEYQLLSDYVKENIE